MEEVQAEALTEAPTAVTTEAPIAVTSEAPTAVTSEAPIAVTSEAPIAVTSEAPTAVTTEAPTEVKVEKPTDKSGAQTVSGILQEIETVKKQNDDRIQRINTVTSVNTFQYIITQSAVNHYFKFDVNEWQVEQNAAEIIAAWHALAKINVVADIFNDKLNYSCETYDDLSRLNSEMYIIAQKYDLFGDTDKARQEVSRFLSNFQLIDTNLKQIEESLKHETSKLEELKNKINDINKQFENLKKENRGLSFGIEVLALRGHVSCYQCSSNTNTMKYYRNNAEPTRSDAHRVNGYSAVCSEHNAEAQASWIFVGTY